MKAPTSIEMAVNTENPAAARRFDVLGFAALSLAIASFQLMLDRGQNAEAKDMVDQAMKLNPAEADALRGPIDPLDAFVQDARRTRVSSAAN